jgi:hypothetical protein
MVGNSSSSETQSNSHDALLNRFEGLDVEHIEDDEALAVEFAGSEKIDKITVIVLEDEDQLTNDKMEKTLRIVMLFETLQVCSSPGPQQSSDAKHVFRTSVNMLAPSGSITKLASWIYRSALSSRTQQ